MSRYYAESRIDDWNIWGAEIEAEDFEFVVIAIWQNIPPQFNNRSVTVFNRETYESRTIMSLHCPECACDVLEDEEWMLTDVPGVYQHVDCYHTERFPEQRTT